MGFTKLNINKIPFDKLNVRQLEKLKLIMEKERAAHDQLVVDDEYVGDFYDKYDKFDDAYQKRYKALIG